MALKISLSNLHQRTTASMTLSILTPRPLRARHPRRHPVTYPPRFPLQYRHLHQILRRHPLLNLKNTRKKLYQNLKKIHNIRQVK